MKLTTRSSYGVRALINLAILYKDKTPVNIKDISHKEKISKVFLEQIFNQLKKNHLVESKRGPKGGYILAREPAKIDIYEVVSILEGDIFTERCFRVKGASCANNGRCASGEVWGKVAEKIHNTLKSFSLEDLATRTVEIEKKFQEK